MYKMNNIIHDDACKDKHRIWDYGPLIIYFCQNNINKFLGFLKTKSIATKRIFLQEHFKKRNWL